MGFSDFLSNNFPKLKKELDNSIIKADAQQDSGVKGLTLSTNKTRHIRGKRIFQGETVLWKEIGDPDGSFLLTESIPVSNQKETQGIFMCGAPGSGKTVTLKFWIDQIVFSECPDRVLIHDAKGDYTSRYPDATILAPFDSRSAIWDIGADIKTLADAREFASSMIERPSKDTFFADSARQVLTGLVVYLIGTTKGRWSWSDLSQILSLPYFKLREAAITYMPEIENVISPAEPGQPADRTSGSIIQTISSAATVIHDCARFLKFHPKAEFWSAREWVVGTEEKGRVVILKSSPEYPDTSRIFGGSVVTAISKAVLGLPDISASERKLWMFLDELPQLGKLERLPAMIETGRSKGIRPVLSIQNISQLKEIYGENISQTISSMIKTWWIGTVSGGETTKWLSDSFGKVEFYEESKSTSVSDPNVLFGQKTNSNSTSFQRVEKDVLTVEILNSLGPSQEGVTAMVTSGGNIHLVNYYFQDEIILRPPYLMAEIDIFGDPNAKGNPDQFINPFETASSEDFADDGGKLAKEIEFLREKQKSRLNEVLQIPTEEFEESDFEILPD